MKILDSKGNEGVFLDSHGDEIIYSKDEYDLSKNEYGEVFLHYKGTSTQPTQPRNMRYYTDLFKGCSQVETLDLSHWDISNAKSFEGMFRGCSKLKILNLGTWVSDSLESCESMLEDCSELEELFIGNIMGSPKLNVKWVFCGCPKLSKISDNRVKTLKGYFDMCFGKGRNYK